MKTNTSVNFWVEGKLQLKLYVSNTENPAIALEVCDDKTIGMAPAFFIDVKDRNRLTAAIVAFNSAWEQYNDRTENK